MSSIDKNVSGKKYILKNEENQHPIVSVIWIPAYKNTGRQS